MGRRLKIDELFIFFVLSLIFIIAFVGDLNYFIPINNGVFFKTITPSEFVIQSPNQGLIDRDAEFSVFDPSKELFYSLDGGKTYQKYTGQKILSMKSRHLFNYQTSIRQTAVNNEFHEVVSVLVKSKDKSKLIFTEPKLFTFYQAYPSKLPLVNLVLNEDDLFNASNGIMMLGNGNNLMKKVS